jgi:hypothetical protein
MLLMRAKLCVLSIALSLAGAEMTSAQTRAEPARSPAAKDDVKGPLTLQGVQGGAPAPTGRRRPSMAGWTMRSGGTPR